MGSFSFTKADNGSETVNIVNREEFKFLIPACFGGGYIRDYYQGYGLLGNMNGNNSTICPKYDMYELLAVWNYKFLANIGKKVILVTEKDSGKINMMPTISRDSSRTENNRKLGIELFFSDYYYEPYIYQLKLVSMEYKGNYEECDGISVCDEFQGLRKASRQLYDHNYLNMLYKVIEATTRFENKYKIAYNPKEKRGKYISLLIRKKNEQKRETEEKEIERIIVEFAKEINKEVVLKKEIVPKKPIEIEKPTTFTKKEILTEIKKTYDKLSSLYEMLATMEE